MAIGRIKIQFKEVEKYTVEHCSGAFAYVSLFPLEEDPPDTVNKTWTIAKNSTNLRISVNDVDLLAMSFEDADLKEDCIGYWGGDVVESFIFTSADKASVSYRVVDDDVMEPGNSNYSTN